MQAGMGMVRFRGIGLALIIGVTGFGSTVAAAASQDVDHHNRTSWTKHDRAVYAVSTLNAPLCSNGEQLSTVLWNQYDAREFDVLASTTSNNLWFIQVKLSTGGLLGVYSYTFGAKLPTGIQSYHCVLPSPSNVYADYKAKNWKLVARFGSTYPKN
jgi:hypothetical protein